MISTLTVDNCKKYDLENIFPQILGKIDVKKELLDNPFTRYLVYIINNKVIGFIHYDTIYDRAELCHIEILTEYYKQGFASKLIEYMINDCTNKNILNITLEVRIDNHKAINLYEKYNFKRVAIRKGYYEGIDAILMEKELIQ